MEVTRSFPTKRIMYFPTKRINIHMPGGCYEVVEVFLRKPAREKW